MYKRSAIASIALVAIAACAHGTTETKTTKTSDNRAPNNQSAVLGDSMTNQTNADVKTEKQVQATLIQKHEMPVVSVNSTRADLNRLSSNQFQDLGMPKDVADNTIKYRDDHHGFKSVDELRQVIGMNEQIFNQLKDKVVATPTA